MLLYVIQNAFTFTLFLTFLPEKITQKAFVGAFPDE